MIVSSLGTSTHSAAGFIIPIIKGMSLKIYTIKLYRNLPSSDVDALKKLTKKPVVVRVCRLISCLIVEELGDSVSSLVKWSSMELISADDQDLESSSPNTYSVNKQGMRTVCVTYN
jgi:hypothetical protein